MQNVQVATIENSVPVSLQVPSAAVPVPVLPIFSEDDGFLTFGNLVAKTTSNRDEV
jgi:hypothetical protein